MRLPIVLIPLLIFLTLSLARTHLADEPAGGTLKYKYEGEGFSLGVSQGSGIARIIAEARRMSKAADHAKSQLQNYYPKEIKYQETDIAKRQAESFENSMQTTQENLSQLKACRDYTKSLEAKIEEFASRLKERDKLARGQCELKTVTCGSLATTFTELEGCTFVSLAKVGEGDLVVGVDVKMFLGVRIEGKVAILGGGAFEKGVVVDCQIGLDRKTKKPDKAALLELLNQLRKSPHFKEEFPGVEAIELAPDLELKEVDKSREKEIESALEKRQ